MEFLCMIAHLLHPFEANIALITYVQPLLVGDLLVLHHLLYLAELSAADHTFMF